MRHLRLSEQSEEVCVLTQKAEGDGRCHIRCLIQLFDVLVTRISASLGPYKMGCSSASTYIK